MKILIDMNLSPRWRDTLVQAGFEATHWSAVGRPDALDTIIMDNAAEHGLVVLTSDLDFSAIPATRTIAQSRRVHIFRDDATNP